MPFDVAPIPLFASDEREEGYYVGRIATRNGSKDWMAIVDPVDDVMSTRRWSNLRHARHIAAKFVKSGERVEAIVEVTNVGRVMHYDGFEQKDPLDQLYEDLCGMPSVVNVAYNDFGSW